MTTLAAVLVRQRALPLETVEQAMLRQSLFGGDLATNLLELGSIDEPALLAATATALETTSLPSGRITGIASDLLGMFPATQLMELPFLLLSSDDAGTIVATSAPLPPAVTDELERQLHRPVALKAALEVRIRQAVSSELGLQLDERAVRLLARLDGAPLGATHRQSGEHARTSVQVPTPRASLTPGMRSLLPSRRESKSHGQPRRLGPVTAAMAEIELTSAQSPGDVIAIWLDFAAQYFDYTAIFAVQGEIAAGKVARGAGTVGEAFSRLGVALDLPSALQRVRAAATWQLTALEPRGLDRTLARDLGRNTGPQVLLVPTCIRERVVLLTYGDHGEDDVVLDRVGDVLALQPLIERHLERILFEKKRAGMSLVPSMSRAASAPERKSPPIPQPEDRPSGAAGEHAAEPSQPRTAEPPRSSDESLPAQPSQQLLADPHEEQTVPAPANPLESADPSMVTSIQPSRSLPSIDSVSIDESWDLIQPVLSVGEGDTARLTRAATNNPSAQARDSSPPGSVWPRASTRPGLSPKLELVSESDGGYVSAPTAARVDPPQLPTSRAEAHPARELAKPSDSKEMGLPTVVVDYERDCLELLERFAQGDAAALGQLIEMGDAAVGVLARELPGPINAPSSRAPRMDQSSKASDCGPVLKALVAFGPVARPYVIARAADADPKVRAWAMRLLGELIGRQSAIAVAQRIVIDRDAEVRRAAYLASHQLLLDPDSAQALRQALLSTAADRNTVITQRLAAIDALADLRDAPSIPHLIELLADPNPGTAAAAQQAISVLARQDFGYDAKSWMSWWKNNATRDRIEWVIDALDHRAATIRQAASEELRLISRLYLGNFDDDSVESRAKMQKKYRDWWAAGGGSNSGPTRR
jgi:hypothetical protein